MSEITGAEIAIRCLLEEGVTDLFGYPGGQVIPFFDNLYNFHGKINFFLPRHEQGAAHMADGYARATGKVGVCLATSGPGATNLVTGIATAYMDSVPMIVITGQVPTHMIGNDAFQEADITGITRPITKHNFLVKDIKDLAQTFKDAFYIARSGRPGPVLIDFPADIQRAKYEFVYPKETSIRSYKPNIKGNPFQIKKAADMIGLSKKPVIYAGGGVVISNASDELRALVDKTGIPITTTLLGLGIYPEEKELSLHMLGMHGTQYANTAVMESDLIIAIGARFDDRVTGKMDAFAPHAKIIHIDIDPTSIGKSIEVDLPIVGDVKEVLRELNKIVKKPECADWVKYILDVKARLPLKYECSNDVIKPQCAIEKLHEITNGKAIIVTDVGQHQMWAAQFYIYSQPRNFLSSGGLGTMGFGLPAGIGAKIGRPNDEVIVIAGDGGIQMNIQEFATLSLYDINVKVVILNNTFLGMVRQWQELMYDRRYSGTDLQAGRENIINYSKETKKNGYLPVFAKVAEAYGIKSSEVHTMKELDAKLKEMIDHKGPYVLDIRIEPEENVFPFVPSGKPLNEMLA